jgi:CheY-like chemotaxis protein
MGQPLRVLVVDDDEGIRNFAERALGRAGYEVVTAPDGLKALRLIDSQPVQSRFDLFVLDVMMPGMRGDELARRLHDRDPETKVLYFTGYADQFFALRPMLRENEAVLVKPVTVKTFLDAVAQRIRQRE